MPDGEAGDGEEAYKLACANFAKELRNLHIEQGRQPYRELVERAKAAGRYPLSVPRISEILTGQGFPRLDYTIELVRVITNDNHEAAEHWRRRWREVEQLRPTAKSSRQSTAASGTSASELDELRAERQWLSVTVQNLELRVEETEAWAKAAEARAEAAETRAGQLQKALYKHWPSRGVALATARAKARAKGTAPVLSLAFHPHGRMLAAGYADGMITVWDTDMALALDGWSSVNNDAGPVHSMAFSPTGDMLAVGSSGGTVRLVLSGASQFPKDPLTLSKDSPRTGGPEICSVAFGPAGLLAAGDAEGMLHVWQCRLDGESGVYSERFYEHHFGGAIRSLAFVSGRKLLAVGTDKGRDSTSTADLLDFESGFGDKQDMKFSGSPVQSVAFSRSGDLLAIAEGHMVHLKSLNDSQSSGTEPHSSTSCDKTIQTLAFNPGADHLAIGMGRTCAFYRVRSNDLQRERTIKVKADTRSLAFRHDGRLLAVGRQDGVVQLYGPDVCQI